MAIHFACPACKATFTVNDRDAGKKSDCKTCGQRIEVPKPPARLKSVLGEVLNQPPMPSPEPATQDQPPPPKQPVQWPTEYREPKRRERRREPRRESRIPAYPNEDSVRVRTELSGPELEQMVEDAVSRLGYVSFVSRGEFEVTGNRLGSFATDVKMAGELYRGREDDEWVLSISYAVQPSAACWTIAILGLLFFLIGLLILIIPFTAKSGIQQAVSQALRDFRNEVER